MNLVKERGHRNYQRRHAQVALPIFLLNINIPAERDPNFMVREYCMVTLAVYLRTCDCVSELGYPAHWISSVLDELVLAGAKKGVLQTWAKPPRSFLN